MKKTGSYVGIFVGSLVVLLLLVAGVWAFKYFTADIRGAVDQREQTIANGQYRIAAYESFYDKCASIQAKEDQIKQTEARKVSKGGSNSGFTGTQKEAILLALENSRAELIRSYNADARKADTRANFLASDLPYQIQIDSETTCD